MAGGPPPPPPGNPGAAAPRPAPWLNRPICDVCKPTIGTRPYESYSPAKLPNWPGGLAALNNNAAAVVDTATIELLMTVLQAAEGLGGPAGAAVKNEITVGAFRALTQPNRITFINRLWNAVTTAHPFVTPIANMTDSPHAAPIGVQPLPTSWCPVTPGATTYHKRVTGQPWRELGVGFRIDGSNDASIQRVLGNGMTQQRANAAFMRNTRGQMLNGTVAADPTTARVWTGNHDIFNESAVCVSRNFFGATAFPLRETDHTGAEYAVLWAVNCLGLTGFDTEAHQLNIPGSRQWRPGEKAFQEIGTDRLLGHVKIQRRGAPAGGGWCFEIARDAAWTITGHPTGRQRIYMVGEINAWRGRHTIPAAFDFAT